MNIFQTLMERRELLRNMTSRELKIRYRGSVLGFLWSILTPLFMAMIYVVFLRVLAVRGISTSEIIIGVFAWQFTVQSINSGLWSISGNVNLVKKVNFPRIILPISATLANLINYLLSLVVQFPIAVILLYMSGQHISTDAVFIPFIIVFHLIFNLALALCMASANVYFRDTQHIVNVVLSAWFFVSPVMYNNSFLEPLLAKRPLLADLFMLNPMAVIIGAYRAATIPGQTFHLSNSVIISIVGTFLLLVFSYTTFQRAQKNFADLL